MKQRNFLHRLIDLVEHELEATLAILIVLAAVVGYSLAATDEATIPGVTVQQTSGLNVNGAIYPGIAFDSTLDADFYLARRLTFASDSPENVLTTKGSGITGVDPKLRYEFSIELAAPYSGSLYAIGTYPAGTVSINRKTVSNSNTPASITDSDTITVTMSGTAQLRGLSTTPMSQTQKQTFSDIYIIPNTASVAVGEVKIFSVLATTSEGSATVNPAVTWSVKPAGIATINSATGELKAVAAGVVTVTATMNGRQASATISIKEDIAAPALPALYPGADEGNDDTNSTEQPATEPTKQVADSTSKPSGANDATSNSWGSSWGEDGYFKAILDVVNPPAEAATQESAVETKSITAQAAAVAAAAYSPAVVEQRVAATGTAFAKNSEVKAIVATQTTTTGKVLTRINLAVQEIKLTFSQLPQGFKQIGLSISRLVLGDKGAGASPLRSGIGGTGEDDDQQ